MKILNLIQCANLGGMEQASLRLMRSLRTRGHELEVLSLNPVGGLGPLLAAAGIPSAGLPYAGRGGWRILPELRRRLRSSEADAVIMTGHHLLGMLAMGDLARKRRILAIHFHHTGVKPDWQWRLIYRLACTRFQSITFPSDFIRLEAERIHPPVAKLAHTIRCPLYTPPIPSPEQRRDARVALGLPLDVPVIGNAGWLIPRKRFDIFLQTAAAVAAIRPEARFLIAGDGEEHSKLKSLATSLNIGDRIVWAGWMQDMDAFYRSVDVLLFNSDSDAMGLTPLEAIAQGIPVAASVTRGGLREVISQPEFGFLIDQHDVSALASAVIKLVSQRALAQQIGEAARRHVLSLSDPDAIAIQYENLWLGQP